MLGGGFGRPLGVAVDASGNVYVPDYYNGVVKEMPAGCTAARYSDGSCAITTLGGIFNHPSAVAVDTNGNVYVADYTNKVVEEVMLDATNFFSVPVGSTSNTETIGFTFDTGGTIQAPAVLTMGAANQDFAATTTTCAPMHTYNPGDTCAVNATFTPKYAGQRMGAVELLNSSGNVIATEYAYGTGTGPQAVFNSTTQSTLGGGFLEPTGVAVDGAGNVYVTDTTNNTAVTKVPVGCANASCITTLGGGFWHPAGVAVDGAGNIYIADYAYNAVKKMPAGCATASCVTTLGGGFLTPAGVSVDASGNVYVADYGHNAVKEMPAGCATASCVTTLGGGFSTPINAVADSSGNIYVADTGNGKLKKMPPGCVTASCVSTLGGSYTHPAGIAVDASGNIYVADSSPASIYEMPAGCTNAGCVTPLSGGFGHSDFMVLDGSGNLYLTDFINNSVVELKRATPPSLNFASAEVGFQSANSPQAATIQNIGNVALTFPVPSSGRNPSIAANFTLDNSTSCPVIGTSSSAGTLAVGSSCTFAVDFIPTAVGSITGSLVATDDNLNAIAPGYTTQTINLSGSAIAAVTATQAIASESLTQNYPANFLPVIGSSGVGTLSFSISPGLPAGLNQYSDRHDQWHSDCC